MNMTRTQQVSLGAVLGVAVLVLGFLLAPLLLKVGGLDAADREQDSARELWVEQEPDAYAYTWSSCHGMCARCGVRVHVQHGEVVDVERAADTPAQSTCPLTEYETIAQQWDRVDDTSSTSVEYDPDYGFPAAVTTSCGSDTSDCGSSWSISDFTVEHLP